MNRHNNVESADHAFVAQPCQRIFSRRSLNDFAFVVGIIFTAYYAFFFDGHWTVTPMFMGTKSRTKFRAAVSVRLCVEYLAAIGTRFWVAIANIQYVCGFERVRLSLVRAFTRTKYLIAKFRGLTFDAILAAIGTRVCFFLESIFFWVAYAVSPIAGIRAKAAAAIRVMEFSTAIRANHIFSPVALGWTGVIIT